MDPSADWRRLTKTVLGVCLIAAPLLFLLNELISSSTYGGDDYGRYLASIAENDTAYFAGNLVGVLGAIALVIGFVALVHLVRVRRPRFAMVVGGLGLLCLASLPGVWLLSTVVEYQMAHSADVGAMATLLEEGEEAASAIPLFVVWGGSMLALLLMAIGLLLARTVARWIPVVLLLGVVLVVVGDSSDVLGYVASALLAVGLGSIGAAILRHSADEWEAGDLTAREPTAPSAPRAPAVAAP